MKTFEVLGSLREVETITTGRAIRELSRLVKHYGRGRWRKRKAVARVRLPDGTVREAEIHWYEAALPGIRIMRRARKGSKRFALCIESGDYPASLERLKLYELVSDADAEAHEQLRIVDESGEDYLYPSHYFKVVPLSPGLHRHVVGRRGRATKRVGSIRTAR